MSCLIVGLEKLITIIDVMSYPRTNEIAKTIIDVMPYRGTIKFIRL